MKFAEENNSLVGIIVFIVVFIVVFLGIVLIGTKNSTISTPENNSVNNSNTTVTKKCQFKNSDGTKTCNNEATHGDLCDYHFNYLNDIYNSYVD